MAQDNPFSDNPFQDPAVTNYTSGGQNGSVAPAVASGGAWGGSSSTPAYSAPAYSAPATTTIPLGGSSNLGAKEQALAKKEAELKAKEAELTRWETDLKRSGSLRPRKNWPKCCPITHLDIAGEVPVELQPIVNVAYWSYLGMCITFLFNLVCTIVAVAAISTGNGRMTGFILALIYVICAIPIAWILWFKPLYNAAIKDRAFTYAWFFLAYLVHIVWCIWAAISPPLLFNDWSRAGWMVTFSKALPDKTIAGIFYIIGSCFWTAESLLSVWVLSLVYRNFRGQKVDARLRSEMAQAAITHAANRV